MVLLCACAAVSAAPGPEPKARSSAISFDDGHGLFRITINRMSIGREAVERGAFYGWQLADAQKMGKTIVYFDLSLTNVGAAKAQYLNISDFTLEDASGNSYTTEQPKDYLHGEVHKGRTARGGVAFYVYKDAVPSVLIYDTKYESVTTGETFYARSPRLDKKARGK